MQISCFSRDQITNHKAHNPPIALFYWPTLHRTVTQVMWNVLAWTLLPSPSVYHFFFLFFFPTERHSSLLQKCFTFSLEREVITDWIKWLMSQLVADDLCINLFRLEFQVLWHIPEMLHWSTVSTRVSATGYISYTLLNWEVDKYVVCFTPLLNMYQSKL